MDFDIIVEYEEKFVKMAGEQSISIFNSLVMGNDQVLLTQSPTK